jgi:hypothetical protein
MRKIALISLSLLLIGCAKEWNCTITTTTELYGTTYTSVSQTTFHGTKSEKEDFENTLTPGQTVICN